MSPFVPPSPNSITVLIVGKGGREHALAWKLAQSPSVSRIFVLPGNAGTEEADKTQNVIHIKPNDYKAIVAFANENGVGLVVAGSEEAVVDGIGDYFFGSGIPCFAPSRAAAEIEGSKVFAKAFMKKYRIPTARGESFEYYSRARAHIKSQPGKVVVKASGLTEGKGVVVARNKKEALEALDDIMVYHRYGKEAGDSVVVEELLEGEEISLHTFCDAHTHRTLKAGQDQKEPWPFGPMCGGTGVYTPTTFISEEDMEVIDRTIIKPTLKGLDAEGRPFRGLLFTVIIMTSKGPKVLGYNARFGDSETQSMLPLLSDDTDLCHVLLACATHKLKDIKIATRRGYACNVVVSSDGYPLYNEWDLPIELAPCPKDILIFHAETRRDDGVLKTAGGRVFSVAARGRTLEEAARKAHSGISFIKFWGMRYRSDIGVR
ncbi:bifunctional purine biosynthetic protein [Apiospora marii]|uniref:phosphoribosylamine--glycine ligase n=1 Tax=Apiospora marii TaxID=335849 RepID=A0ABR1RG33_9PEZI